MSRSVCPSCAQEYETEEGVVVRVEESSSRTKSRVVSERVCSEKCGEDLK